MAKYRQGRLAEEIRRLITDMLRKDLKDPRLDTLITITGVEVTKDGSYATVYLDVLDPSGSEEDQSRREQDVLDGLASASGVIRGEIGRQMRLRRAPELIFRIDRSQEYGRHIDEVIKGLGL